MAVSRGWRRAAWLGVVAALALALLAGSGALGGASHPRLSLYQRTLQVAGQYRCPVCADESAAVSDAPAAVEIRDRIEAWLKQGDSPAQVQAYMVQYYGSSILEKPPASGTSLLVWVLPVLAAALALTGLGLAFARWRRAAALSPSSLAWVTPAAGPREPPAPVQQVLFAKVPVPGRARASLSSQEAGEASEVGEVGEVGEGPGRGAYLKPRLRTGWAQRALAVAGAGLVVLAGALWLVDRSSSSPAAGQAATAGSTDGSSITYELVEADLLAPKHPLDALVIYQEVLRADPAQPVALAAEGWIYAQGGFVGQGLSLLAKAEKADPSYPPPHLYRGLVLLDKSHRPVAAATELKWYLAHKPNKAQLQTARAALAQAEAEITPAKG